MTQFPPYINIHTHQWVDGELTIKSVGIHPYMAENPPRLDFSAIDSDIEAIGEIGLDFSRSINKELQEQLFRHQLSIAEKLSLPVVIHSVRATERVSEILKEYSLKGVIFHGFIGSEQQALKLTSRGYYLSFGHRCFSSPKTLRALNAVPITNIFFETDDNDITIEQIYNLAAEQRKERLERLKAEIYKNYINIFKKQ